KRLPNASLIALDQRVCLGVDTAHASDEDEVARARTDIPRSGCLDRALGRQRFNSIGRGRLGECGGCAREQNCRRRDAEIAHDCPSVLSVRISLEAITAKFILKLPTNRKKSIKRWGPNERSEISKGLGWLDAGWTRKPRSPHRW